MYIIGILDEETLRKKCSCSELFWSVSSRIRIEYEEIQSISLYSIQMWENTDQNNSEHGHFSRRKKLSNFISFPALLDLYFTCKVSYMT